MTTPAYLVRRLVCAIRGHDPFPWNPAARPRRARCWRCGDTVNTNRTKGTLKP